MTKLYSKSVYIFIYSAWKQWSIAYKQFNVKDKDASSTEDVTAYVTDDAIDPKTVAYLKRHQGIYIIMSISYLYQSEYGILVITQDRDHARYRTRLQCGAEC